MGGGQFVYVFPFFLGEKRETHKQNSKEISEKGPDSPGIIPGQSMKTLCFLAYWFFLAPYMDKFWESQFQRHYIKSM